MKNKQSTGAKLFYIFVLIVGLILIWLSFQNTNNAPDQFPESNDSVIPVGVDEDGNAAVGDAVEVIEENPDETGDEGETIVQE